MNYFIYLLLFFMIWGCSNKSQNVQKSDKEVIYNNPEDYIQQNKNRLIRNYNKYFGGGIDGVGNLSFDILSNKELIFNKTKFWGIKISAKGKPDWSYQEKFILINNHGDVLYEKDFRQIEPELKIPECGVPNYFIDTLDLITMKNNDFLKAQIKEHFKPCGGQPRLTNSFLYFYSLEKFELIDSLEVLHKHSNYGHPDTIRNSDISINKGILTIKQTEYIDNRLMNKSTKKYRLTNKGLITVK